jgi:NADPH-dependent 2,4-dienoyl-CoA reductase/sulfur reductase-like enzyme
MTRCRYLIVGGGMAGASAIKGIREVDPDGDIAVACAEGEAPYQRPPLSKSLWKGKPFEKVWMKAEAEGVRLLLGREVLGLDPGGRRASFGDGSSLGFEKVLLATGSRPRRLPFEDDALLHYRTLDDYRRLRSLAEAGKSFAVVGGGFIGSEIAAALAMNGKQVQLLFPGPAIGHRILPRDLSLFLNGYYSGKGVEPIPGESPAALERLDGRLSLRLRGGRVLEVDGVVAGIGVDPALELAASAGLGTGDGVEVDGLLRTGLDHVYAAGDIAAYVCPALGRRLRVEHEDNALAMGVSAGRNMASAACGKKDEESPYGSLPLFYSDLFDNGFEAVGEIDSRLETVEDWKPPFEKGFVYYLREGKVRGVLIWNLRKRADAARALIERGEVIGGDELVGAIQ